MLQRVLARVAIPLVTVSIMLRVMRPSARGQLQGKRMVTGRTNIHAFLLQ